MPQENFVHVDAEMEPDPELNRWTNLIIGCGIAVHRELGPGQLEAVYERALKIEFEHRDIPFQNQVPVALLYRGQVVGEGRMDFVVAGLIVLDTKAAETIVPAHVKQMISYLRMTRLRLGLIMNFNVSRLADGVRRIAN